MCQWVLKGRKKTHVLEPAYGLGIFSRVIERTTNILVDAYEADPIIFNAAQSVLPIGVDLVNDDYFLSDWSTKYDAIICNPPYFKFHDYDNASYIPDVNKHLGTKLSGFTNLYSLFLLKSLAQLQEGGRLAYIVPSEFLNADYGVEVKRALIESNALQHIIIVDFTECAFDDALTTACIILCERCNGSHNVRFSVVKDVQQLNSSFDEFVEYQTEKLDAEKKWKAYYEDRNCVKYNHLVPFSTFAKVSRGIATGANDYFTFKLSKVDEYNIPQSSFRHCICHASDVSGQVFTSEDFEKIANRDKTVFLFDGSAEPDECHVQFYIHLGEEIGVNKKYLTASRKPWYALENREPSPIWVSVFNRNGLRFIRNKAGVYNLTTFHCVYNISDIDTEILFSYLVTNVAKEIFLDNSRQYGNGLIKFEPNDLNKGMVVDLRLLSTEENVFIKQASVNLQRNDEVCNQTISLLDDFFRQKYVLGWVDLPYFKDKICEVGSMYVSDEVRTQYGRIKQLNFFDIFEQYGEDSIVENDMVRENCIEYSVCSKYNHLPIIQDKNLLICNVKKDNWMQFIDGSAKVYYTGKKFPTTIALNNLYYFMPYLSGKGIRDLYYIKVARLGYRREGQENVDKNDLRLVFEIERVGQLFDDYKKVKLEIWHTFTDTTMAKIQETCWSN